MIDVNTAMVQYAIGVRLAEVEAPYKIAQTLLRCLSSDDYYRIPGAQEFSELAKKWIEQGEFTELRLKSLKLYEVTNLKRAGQINLEVDIDSVDSTEGLILGTFREDHNRIEALANLRALKLEVLPILRLRVLMNTAIILSAPGKLLSKKAITEQMQNNSGRDLSTSLIQAELKRVEDLIKAVSPDFNWPRASRRADEP